MRTEFTRSRAIRDHDSNRLWANQQAAGPNPLILCVCFSREYKSVILLFRLLLDYPIYFIFSLYNHFNHLTSLETFTVQSSIYQRRLFYLRTKQILTTLTTFPPNHLKERRREG